MLCGDNAKNISVMVQTVRSSKCFGFGLDMLRWDVRDSE